MLPYVYGKIRKNSIAKYLLSPNLNDFDGDDSVSAICSVTPEIYVDPAKILNPNETLVNLNPGRSWPINVKHVGQRDFYTRAGSVWIMLDRECKNASIAIYEAKQVASLLSLTLTRMQQLIELHPSSHFNKENIEKILPRDLSQMIPPKTWEKRKAMFGNKKDAKKAVPSS